MHLQGFFKGFVLNEIKISYLGVKKSFKSMRCIQNIFKKFAEMHILNKICMHFKVLASKPT